MFPLLHQFGSMVVAKLGIEITMVLLFFAILGAMLAFSSHLTLNPVNNGGNWLPTKNDMPKRNYEVWALKYTVFWIAIFGCVVVGQLYERFDGNAYFALCFSLALPLMLQPFVWPLGLEKNYPFYMRYSFKATVWLSIFTFVGNYWYTHYFYSVLKAKYTFPAHRINEIPICLFFATLFYFVTYHTAANLILRKITTRYMAGWQRNVFFWAAILAFSYFTAFMETLTISSFPYYSFEDRFMAYTLGSAFYGIYFIVSYPAFYSLDEPVEGKVTPPSSIHSTIMEACGASMIVLCLLDFCRVHFDIPLTIPGGAFYLYKAVVKV